MELSGNDYLKNAHAIHYLISQGKDMGIYTWLIHSIDHPFYLLELARTFPDCAFPIFCTVEDITSALLDEANDIYNIMFIVEYCDDMEAACALLRSHKFLYSISYSYKEQDVANIINDEILHDTENLHSAFTLFYSKIGSFTEPSSVYQYILQARDSQNFKTIPFDIIHDNYWIDSIISDQPCSVFFTQNGDCYSLTEQTLYENCNYFNNTLLDILQKVAPQK